MVATIEPSRPNRSPMPRRHRAGPGAAVLIFGRSRLLASRRRRCCPARAGLFVVSVVLALRGAAVCRALIGRRRGTRGAAGRRRCGLRQHRASCESRRHDHRKQKFRQTHLLVLSVEVGGLALAHTLLSICVRAMKPFQVKIQQSNCMYLNIAKNT